jgi:hypothetical protein
VRNLTTREIAKGLLFTVALLFGLNGVNAGENALPDYGDLKAISFFGSISASIHIPDSAKPADSAGLSPENLTKFMRLQFARHFAGIEFRDIDVSRWSNEEYRRTMARLSCRVWMGGDESPVTYQVKCQISTADHLNIIDDASLGYGSKEKMAMIIPQQIDRMLESFALTFFRIRSGR